MPAREKEGNQEGEGVRSREVGQEDWKRWTRQEKDKGEETQEEGCQVIIRCHLLESRA